MQNSYLTSAIKQFEYYKALGEKTFAQVTDEKINWQYNDDSNSIANLVKHLSGNMLSRWTDFLTTDGEKEGRNRDAEFEKDIINKEELLLLWNKGWDCLFTTLHSLTVDDLEKEIFIRNMGQPVTDAINRQLAHYGYHVGQIVFIGKMVTTVQWQSLSIPKGNSQAYNAEKFAKPKRTQSYIEEMKKEKE
jgi:hypothetical protein